MNRLVKAVLRGEGVPAATVGLCLSDDVHLHTLNRDFRGQDRPTDVLSFPSGPLPGEPDDGYLGDVVISMERAVAQAPRFGASLEQETARLVVHGLLHLLGYDHHAPADGRRMKSKERLYLGGVEPGSIVP